MIFNSNFKSIIFKKNIVKKSILGVIIVGVSVVAFYGILALLLYS